jgi:proteasome accessory factor B
VADAVERLVNLAFYLADAPEPVTAERIRVDVDGYDTEQDEVAFNRMFERDKEILREAGLAIVSDDGLTYRLDRAATFATGVELSPDEAAAVRAAGAAMMADPSFPFPADLRLALAKVSSAVDAGPVAAASRLADEEPARQGETVALLADAAERRKRVTFDYTNTRGEKAPHEIEPYGLFLHDGRWYLVGRDTAKSETRTYTVSRAQRISIDPARPKSPDFERPGDFDVRSFLRLPFQYGPAAEHFEAHVRFDSSAAWRASALAGGQGMLTSRDDGGVDWLVSAANERALARFVLENHPGISLVGPPEAVAVLHDGLRRVVAHHGR